jgi:hypothetical protein
METMKQEDSRWSRRDSIRAPPEKSLECYVYATPLGTSVGCETSDPPKEGHGLRLSDKQLDLREGT